MAYSWGWKGRLVSWPESLSSVSVADPLKSITAVHAPSTSTVSEVRDKKKPFRIYKYLPISRLCWLSNKGYRLASFRIVENGVEHNICINENVKDDERRSFKERHLPSGLSLTCHYEEYPVEGLIGVEIGSVQEIISPDVRRRSAWNFS